MFPLIFSNEMIVLDLLQIQYKYTDGKKELKKIIKYLAIYIGICYNSVVTQSGSKEVNLNEGEYSSEL